MFHKPLGRLGNKSDTKILNPLLLQGFKTSPKCLDLKKWYLREGFKNKKQNLIGIFQLEGGGSARGHFPIGEKK